MRIISGNCKGKKILEPVDKKTRPLRDLVKESIFNLLLHSNFINLNLKECLVLDLFSGSGSFGLECLSRNAKHVTFVENHKPAIETLYKNVRNFNLLNNYLLINQDIFSKKFASNLNKKFDLIFADPPYKEERIPNLFSILCENKILKKNGLFIVHRNKKSYEFNNDRFKIIEIRIYGISKIIFYKLK